MMRRELERESLKDAVPSLSWHNDCFYIFCFDKSVRCVFRFIVFAEDFEGRNGRSKKKLWLTEVAAASNNGTFVTNFVHDLLSEESGARKILFWAFVLKTIGLPRQARDKHRVENKGRFLQVS